MGLFSGKGKTNNYEQRAGDVEQMALLHLLMGHNTAAARFLVCELQKDPDPAHATCQRALALYKLERYDTARQALQQELGRAPLDVMTLEKYAIHLTDIGVLTLTGSGYMLATSDISVIDKHMAMSIHYLRAGRIAEAREEAQIAEQSREGKHKVVLPHLRMQHAAAAYK
jgi:tetratricopeptide (TPR) repeat protein